MKAAPLNGIEKGNRIIILAGLVILFLIPYFYNPFTTGITQCAFKELTGYPCPSCGMSRSFFHTGHFRVLDAFSFHLLGPFLYLFLMLTGIKFIAELIVQKKFSFPGINWPARKIFVLAGTVFIANWVFTLIIF